MADQEPAWLDDEEALAWRALVSVVTRLPSVLNTQLTRDADLTHFEYMVMAVLSEADDRTLRMSDIARVTDAALPRLSQVVGRLEGRGWVTRAPDPADGRSTLATLTSTGWDTVVATAPGHVEEVRRLVFDPLTRAQVRQLAEIGARIMSVVDPGGRYAVSARTGRPSG